MKTNVRGYLKAFTLIELLIVVAIIAILAAIAVPNFLEAQTRAKAARSKNDLRVVVTALESYYVDNNKYPHSNTSSRAIARPSEIGNPGHKQTLERLTSPIAYISAPAFLRDPFQATKTYQGTLLDTEMDIGTYPDIDRESFASYWYCARNEQNSSIWDDPPPDPAPKWWIVESAGPDLHHHNLGTALNALPLGNAGEYAFILKCIYDATNGTVSRGSIWRAGGEGIGDGKVLYTAAMAAQK